LLHETLGGNLRTVRGGDDRGVGAGERFALAVDLKHRAHDRLDRARIGFHAATDSQRVLSSQSNNDLQACQVNVIMLPLVDLPGHDGGLTR